MNTPFQYFHYLEQCNPNLQGVEEYILYPGMEFGSREKWWPDSGMRPTAHEGIDICYYRNAAGKEKTLPLTSNLTVMASGRVAAICRDFLGYSLFLDHEYEDELRFLSVYAHIAPQNSIAVGQYLHPGDVIGSIADTVGRKNRMVAHLHVTLMQVERSVPPEKYDWDLINRSPYSRLIDPLQMTAAEKIVLRPTNPHKEKGMQQ